MNKFVFLVSITLLLVGCASHDVARQPDLSYDLKAQQNKAENSGVHLLVRAVHQQSDLEQYYGGDLLQYGVLPLQVNVQNRQYPRNLVFSTDGVQLIDSAGHPRPQLTIDQVMKKAKKSFWRTAGWGVAFGLFGIIPSAINVNKTNKKIRADYESRLLQSGNLQTGSMTEGILFYSVPPDVPSLNGWNVNLVMRDGETAENVNFEYGLAGTIAQRKKEDNEESEVFGSK